MVSRGGSPSSEEFSRDIPNQVEVNCKHAWRQRSPTPRLPWKPSPRIFCHGAGDADAAELRRPIAGLTSTQPPPRVAQLRRVRREEAGGQRALPRRRKVAAENAGWGLGKRAPEPASLAGGTGLDFTGRTARAHSPNAGAGSRPGVKMWGPRAGSSGRGSGGPTGPRPLFSPPAHRKWKPRRGKGGQARGLVGFFTGVRTFSLFLFPLGLVQCRCHSAGGCLSVSFFSPI